MAVFGIIIALLIPVGFIIVAIAETWMHEGERSYKEQQRAAAEQIDAYVMKLRRPS